MDIYLEETRILDFSNPTIQQLIKEKKWGNLDKLERIKSVYNFVRDEILFGYNSGDDILASQVIKDGIGQCNTKATLLMALLRGVGIPCRLHGATIDKPLQKGAFSSFWYHFAPKEIVHSWVELSYNDVWFELEGVILDKKYLHKLQEKFKAERKNFCGFGAYTEDLMSPIIDWNENDTAIQKLGINQDFGVYKSPDDFYDTHQQNVSLFKKIIFKLFVRKSNNRNVEKVREHNCNPV